MTGPPRLDDRGDDPRTPAAGFGPDADADRPAVAGPASRAGLWGIVGGAGLLGGVVFLFLASHHKAGPDAAPSPSAFAAPSAAGSPPPDLAFIEAQARGTGLSPTAPPVAPSVVGAGLPPPIVASGPVESTGADAALAQRRRTPSLVVDLDSGGGATAPAAGPDQAASQGASGSPKGAAPQLTGNEQFAERIGAAEPDRARATSLSHPRTVVPQGTMIPAVLETAMNSDLPGFVRAVVSRDVRGFDGASVLIPRGSRLVGQYRSDLAPNASRIFVIWTRVLRPDGVSVQIGSPGGDPLGRAGQEGKVHSHFLRQFADSILLSVINAEVSNLAAQPSTQIIIGGATTGLTSSAAPTTTATTTGSTPTAPVFPPTITVQQGSPISIFVARDLDFSTIPEAAK